MALLTTLQVADSLGCSGLHVDRAIAIGELEAHRVGQGGPYRIDEAAIVAWGRNGYQRVDMPTAIVRNWYDGNDRNIDYHAGNFRGQIADELKSYADAQAEPAANVTVVTVTPTARMKALAASPVPPMLTTIKTKRTPPPPFSSSIENAVIQATRSAAAGICRQRQPNRPALSVLFAGIDEFAAISREAVAAALASPINYRKSWPGKTGAFSQPHDVRFSVSLGSLVAGNLASFTKRVVELSF